MTLLKITALSLFGILLLSMSTTICTADGDSAWSSFGGGPEHTHLSEWSTEGNRGGLAWQLRFNAMIGGQPVITDRGTLIVNDVSGNVTEVSANGAKIKQVDLGEGCKRTPALGTNGTIVIASGATLHVLDRNLTEIWSMNFTRQLSSPTIAHDGTIYISTEAIGLVSSSGLYAISKEGAIKWFIPNQYVDSGKTPAIGPDGTIYDGGMELPVRAVSPEGQVLWQYRGFDPMERSSADSAPICVGPDGTVYVGTFDQGMYAFHSDGTVKWRYDVEDAITTSPSLGPDGTVYFTTQDLFSYGMPTGQRLHAIDEQGDHKWSFDLNSAISSSAAVSSDGRIYLYDLLSGLIALDQYGDVIWIAGGWPEISGWDSGSPVIGKDGTVYGLLNGGLMAFNIGAPGQPREVNMFRDGPEVRLSWTIPYTDGGSQITGYAVYRNAWRSDPYYYEERVLVAMLDGPEVRTFQDQGLTEGVYYSYQVCAVNEYGEGLSAEAEPSDETPSWQMPLAVILVFVVSVCLVWYGFGMGRKEAE